MESILEWRKKNYLFGTALYVTSSIFVAYLTVQQLGDERTWNALFWIILLFATMHSSSKSFIQNTRQTNLYYYTLVTPQTYILAKQLFNIIVMVPMAAICAFVYCLVLGNLITDIAAFAASVVLGTIGLSCLITMMSAIASKAENSYSLLAILSFPLLVPLLMIATQLSEISLTGIGESGSFKLMMVLLLTDAIVILLSYLLFPYLWKE